MFFFLLLCVKNGMKIYFIDKDKVYIYEICEVKYVILDCVDEIDDCIGVDEIIFVICVDYDVIECIIVKGDLKDIKDYL